ncbi:MAG: hypothetical protein V3T05_12800, partial [Myxococcota bacterium]
MRADWFAGLGLAALCLLPDSAGAVPRFAVQQGAGCSLCHANPTGGGARTDYGRGVYARQVLSMNLTFADEAVPLVDPTLGGNVAIGADLRAVYTHALPRAIVPDERALREIGSFMLMQGDIYLTARLGSHVQIYFDQGTYGSQEIFARLIAGPVSLKAGKFMPAYGWRLPDHTAITRESIGFGPRARDTGVALVLDGVHHTIELGAFNGGGAEPFLDTDLRRAFAVRLVGRVG